MIKKFLFAVYLIFICLISFSQSDSSLFFVQITDTHIGKYDHFKRTEKIIKSINELPFNIQFVVHTGDIFQNNILNDLVCDSVKHLFSQLKVPVFFVPGNHDILENQFKDCYNKYIKQIGYTDTVIVIDNTAFMFLYTGPLEDSENILYKSQLKKIDSLFNSYKNQNKIIFHHIPSVSDFYNNKIHQGWDSLSFNRWKSMLKKNNVTAVIAGHFHRDELHWIDNIPVYVSSSVAGFWGRQASYRIYEYKNNKLTYRTVYIY
ncbi:MAG: hypothetical protein Kow0068_02060 [Marinilabiliales bacterium]